MMNVKVTVVFKRFFNNEYHHFTDYVETNPKRMHPFSRGNNKFKIKALITKGGWIEIDNPFDIQAAYKSGRLEIIENSFKKFK